VEIGRLMVAPDYAGHGIGRWLLDFAEHQAPASTQQITLYTGAKSYRNIDIYQRAGFVIDGAPVRAGVVHLSKRA
jgi:GNAT superfamily N-acetyltransferase